MSQTAPAIYPAGETCCVVDFGNTIDLETNARVQALKRYLQENALPGLEELVPTYRSLAVYFDPLKGNLSQLQKLLEEGVASSTHQAQVGTEEVVVPVCYGGEYGPDLDSVGAYHNIAPQEVIQRHTARSCYCYMLGFTPGFAYLGGMDETIATPRLENPREVIPAGSVGIAGKQTGMYPIDSPGGWQLIGRTPLRLYNPEATPVTLIQAGVWIRFAPISSEEYGRIEKEVSRGIYVVEKRQKGECS